MFYFFLHECFDISRPHNALGKDSSHHKDQSEFLLIALI